jgi:ribosomal protein L44E
MLVAFRGKGGYRRKCTPYYQQESSLITTAQAAAYMWGERHTKKRKGDGMGRETAEIGKLRDKVIKR